MNWIEVLQQLGVTAVWQSLLFLILGFFGKQLYNKFLDKDIEVFKHSLISETEKLKLELNKILESHRSELNILNAKNSRLYEKQTEIIAELYKRIVIMDKVFKEMIAWIKPTTGNNTEEVEQERILKSVSAYNDFTTFYTENKIFFSGVIGNKLETLRENFWDSHWDYTFKRRMNINDTELTKKHFDDAAKTITEKVPEVLKELEVNFRKLLNVE